MALSTIRKAIAAVKDQTSISLAKVAGNVAPDLEVLVVKATTHDNEPADEKYIGEILNMVAYSQGYVHAFICAISKRLNKTRDWIVALKSLMLVHRLLSDGDPAIGQELMFSSHRGTRPLNMSGFRDGAHSKYRDHSGFVRAYALYLNQMLEFMVYERKLGVVGDRMNWKTMSFGNMNEKIIRVKRLRLEKVSERLSQLIMLLECCLGCRPTGVAKDDRMVLVAVYLLVKDSFTLYANTSGLLDNLVECLSELDFSCSVEAVNVYVNASKIIDELVVFYSWCEDVRIAQSSEFPEVKKIGTELLGMLKGVVREKGSRNGSKRTIGPLSDIKEEKEQNLNEVKALPSPLDDPPVIPQQPLQNPVTAEDLMNLKDEGVSADRQDDIGEWVEFDGVPNATSEAGKPDWELELVESASQLPKQKADLGGVFDLLLLNGMYDQGTVMQYVKKSLITGGSTSSVASSVMSKSASDRVLALPAPDGTVQPVSDQDPFAASVSIPPPAYMQIADMGRKQQLLRQEQQLWQLYARNRMQGQIVWPHGMP